jgi:hypothetical protein
MTATMTHPAELTDTVDAIATRVLAGLVERFDTAARLHLGDQLASALHDLHQGRPLPAVADRLELAATDARRFAAITEAGR